jgi:RNA polymerase sigma factor (TIGR02999 family)
MEQFTRLLDEAQQGDASAAAKLLPLVYEKLRSLAQKRMKSERAGHTLQATALVHEAYLKLVGNQDIRWSGRSHFFLAAAEAMRRILIDHARARGGPKRGGTRKRVPMNNVLDLAIEERFPEFLAVDEAISRLQKESPDLAQMVRLRFYGGLSVDETAHVLGVSASTVRRDWTYARAWLKRQLADEE